MMNYLNEVFCIDILKFISKLPDNSMDLVYGDPDYNVGINYAGMTFNKRWDDYIDWYIELSKECMRVLKPTGNYFTINYPKQNAYLRVKYLDEKATNVFDYVWVYNTNIGHAKNRFTTAHRSILHATKSKNNAFYKEQVAVPYKNLTDKRIVERIKQGNVGRMPYSWFYFNLVKNVSRSKTFHACQIPETLVEMLIKATTKKDDKVLILFGGSGTEILITKRLGRNFLSCEINKKYYNMIMDRLNSENKKLAENWCNNGQFWERF